MKFSKKGVSIGLALIVILSIFSVTIFYISDYYKRDTVNFFTSSIDYR